MLPWLEVQRQNPFHLHVFSLLCQHSIALSITAERFPGLSSVLSVCGVGVYDC